MGKLTLERDIPASTPLSLSLCLSLSLPLSLLSFVSPVVRAWRDQVAFESRRRCAVAPSSREFQRRRPDTKRAGGTGPARPTAAYPSALIIRDKTLVRSVIEGVKEEGNLRAPTARTRSRLFPADRNLGTAGTGIDISINLPRAYPA